jgi:hypothetical protein
MTLRYRITAWALTSLMRLAWRTEEATRWLGQAGVRLENWLDRTAAYRGIVLAPLTERHSGAGEA